MSVSINSFELLVFTISTSVQKISQKSNSTEAYNREIWNV